MIFAACKGKSRVVELLLKGGAGLRYKDSDGWTAYMWASWNGHKDVMALILKYKIKRDKQKLFNMILTKFDFKKVLLLFSKK